MQYLLPLSVTNIKKHQTQMVNVKGRGKVRGMIRDTVKDAICHCSASHYRAPISSHSVAFYRERWESSSLQPITGHVISVSTKTPCKTQFLFSQAPFQRSTVESDFFFSLSIFSRCNRRYLPRERDVLVSLGRFKRCLFLTLRYRKSSCVTRIPETEQLDSNFNYSPRNVQVTLNVAKWTTWTLTVKDPCRIDFS